MGIFGGAVIILSETYIFMHYSHGEIWNYIKIKLPFM